MLEPDMIKETAIIVNEVQKDKVQINLIINNRAGGNAPLIARQIADASHLSKQTHINLPPFVNQFWQALYLQIRSPSNGGYLHLRLAIGLSGGQPFRL
jgi:hypothetical protein